VAEHSITLDQSGGRALQLAQEFCLRANVAIVGAEHLLAGALAVISESGNAAVPDRAALESALMLAQGSGESGFAEQVMFGSAAREAINDTAGAVRIAGGSTVGARELALGAIDSGNITPMFYASLNTTRDALKAAIKT
jgi:hypothetical protein